jgi:hypothetical protein
MPLPRPNAPDPARCPRRTPVLRLVLIAAAMTAGLLSTPRAQPQGAQLTRNATAPDKPRSAVTAVRAISTRSHMQCPLPGKNSRLLSIDSPREWEDTIEHQDEVTALGRKVRWAKERVLVYALDSKPHAGVRLESPAKVIRLSHGVLYWPVRQILPDTKADKATVLTRPCVMTTIDRAYWQRIKVVPAPP